MLMWAIILYGTLLSLVYNLLQASASEIGVAIVLFAGLMAVKYLVWRWITRQRRL